MIPPILTKNNQKKVISTMEIAWFKTIPNVLKTLSKLKINRLIFCARFLRSLQSPKEDQWDKIWEFGSEK